MTRVLVTGASGFIGRHVLGTLLKRGVEVHAVRSNSGSLALNPDCTWHLADLLVASQVATLIRQIRPTHLLHLAWYTTPGKYWTAQENFVWVQASLELLKQFQAFGGHRVVMAGTCAEYDWRYGYCSEFVTPEKSTSPYSICKSALQNMLAAYSTQTGLSSAWGRIFFLYGPYEHPKRFVASVIQSLLKGEPAHCSHGNQIRDFLYVQDVADAFIALLFSEIAGPVNIASGKPVSLKTIAFQLTEQLGGSKLLRLGALPAPETEPPLLVANTQRLTQDVNWQPKYELATGLKMTIDWWKTT